MIIEEISINQAAKRLLATIKGARVLRPDYGISHDLIDKNLDAEYAMKLRRDIYNQFKSYLPEVKLNKISFEYDQGLKIIIDSNIGEING